MRLSNYVRETAQSLLNKVVSKARKGFNPLKESYVETVELAREHMPEIVEVMEDYVVRPYKSLHKPDQAGICEEVTIARSKLIRAFKVSTPEQIEAMTRWGTYQHESYLYNLIETTFDMSLLVEQGLASTFQQDYELQKSIVRVRDGLYIGQYRNVIIAVDTKEGEVFRLKDTYTRGHKKVKQSIIHLQKLQKTGTVEFEVLKDFKGNEISTYVIGIYDCELVENEWKNLTKNKNGDLTGLKYEKGKVYQRVQLSSRYEDDYGKAYYISVHHLMGMCEWGYNSTKHCRGFASILTIDHIDGNTLNNNINNLRLMTRSDNTSIAGSECKRGYDWVEFFKRVEKDREDAKGYGKAHYEMLKGLYERDAV